MITLFHHISDYTQYIHRSDFPNYTWDRYLSTEPMPTYSLTLVVSDYDAYVYVQHEGNFSIWIDRRRRNEANVTRHDLIMGRHLLNYFRREFADGNSKIENIQNVNLIAMPDHFTAVEECVSIACG